MCPDVHLTNAIAENLGCSEQCVDILLSVRLFIYGLNSLFRYQHGDIVSWDRIELDKGSKKIYTVEGSEPSRDLTESDITVLKQVKAFALEEVKV